MTAIAVLPDWPRDMDRDLALLAPTVADFEAKLNVAFRRDTDDLDDFSYLPVRVGRDDYVLQAHDHSPAPGVVLRSKEGDPATLEARLGQAVSALGLSEADVTWHSPVIDERPGPVRRLRSAFRGIIFALSKMVLARVRPRDETA